MNKMGINHERNIYIYKQFEDNKKSMNDFKKNL
jgi:hypothetical protein